MKDKPSASTNDAEPPRPECIPHYFIWYPDMRAWDAPPQPPESGWDGDAWLREFQEELKNLSPEERRKGVITVDELRAAGALDVPPEMRKSLNTEPNLFGGLFADAAQEAQQEASDETDDEASGGEA